MTEQEKLREAIVKLLIQSAERGGGARGAENPTGAQETGAGDTKVQLREVLVALQLASAYMGYVRHRMPSIDLEADGTPSARTAVEKALAILDGILGEGVGLISEHGYDETEFDTEQDDLANGKD